MILVQFEKAGKHFGGVEVFSNVTWQIDSGQRIGMVGDNGAGKTTLFRLITGRYSADEGRVTRHSDARIALLDQIPDLGRTTSRLGDRRIQARDRSAGATDRAT